MKHHADPGHLVGVYDPMTARSFKTVGNFVILFGKLTKIADENMSGKNANY